MSQYAIGLSALRTGQRALDIIGQNVTNANTPGYSRQVVALASKSTDGLIGDGVGVNRVMRYSSEQMRNMVYVSQSERDRLATRLESQRQSEAFFTPGDGTLDKRLAGFYDQLTAISTRPEDETQRKLFATAAQSVGQQFQSLAVGLTQQKSNAAASIRTTIVDINEIAPKITDLNQRIVQMEAQGATPNDLKDQRDTFIRDLSKLVDVRANKQENGVYNIMAGNAPLVVGEQSFQLEAIDLTNGQLQIQLKNITPQFLVSPTGGKLGGLMEEHNVALPGYQTELDEIARTFMAKVDAIQATGLGSNGPYLTTLSSRGPDSTTLPLNTSGLDFPMQAGDLVITMTDTATNQRVNYTVAVDPATQSLQDVLTSIATATSGQLTGTINPGPNTVQFQAAAGYRFDFAGRLPSQPLNVAMAGTSVPEIGGTYTGSTNDNYSFEIVGTGTIGVTPGLMMQVRDSANTVIGTYNVGEGYSANSWIQTQNAVQVRLGAGTTNNGTFETSVINNADTSGFLGAIGVNSMFQGSDASSIAVKQEMLLNPTRIALSRSGESGDISNLKRMIALRDEKVYAGNTQSIQDGFLNLTSSIGLEVSTLSAVSTAQSNLQNNLEQQELSLSGVDINEEMLNLMSYQRMVESASRYLSVVNTAMDSILEIVR